MQPGKNEATCRLFEIFYKQEEGNFPELQENNWCSTLYKKKAGNPHNRMGYAMKSFSRKKQLRNRPVPVILMELYQLKACGGKEMVEEHKASLPLLQLPSLRIT